jgi:hypothetical protein
MTSRDTPAVKVGVLLARRPEELGEWLADAGAWDAAGADAIWVDPAPEARLDPLALLAALAGLTTRTLLVGEARSAGGPPEAFGRTLTTIARLSRGRLALVADPEQAEELSALAPGLAAFRRLPEEPGAFARPREDGVAERWVKVPSPESRAAWRAALAEAAEGGIGGLLVPAGPRLLDMLRNPDDPGERRDLYLAQG